MKRARTDSNSVPVYMTGLGRVPSTAHTGPSPGPAAGSRGAEPSSGRPVARLRIERAGRGGKTVTVAAGLVGTPEELRDLLKDIKSACGSGGTLRETAGGGDLELQGDHLAKVAASLEKRGYLVKGAGKRA